MTILIGSDGGVQLIQDCDWPLDALIRERGPQTAFRVTSANGIVRVEGREGQTTCRLEANTPAGLARQLFRAMPDQLSARHK